MIHRSRLDDSRKLNNAHKHEMDQMKIENSTLLSFLRVGADLSQGISVKRSKEVKGFFMALLVPLTLSDSMSSRC